MQYIEHKINNSAFHSPTLSSRLRTNTQLITDGRNKSQPEMSKGT